MTSATAAPAVKAASRRPAFYRVLRHEIVDRRDGGSCHHRDAGETEADAVVLLGALAPSRYAGVDAW